MIYYYTAIIKSVDRLHYCQHTHIIHQNHPFIIKYAPVFIIKHQPAIYYRKGILGSGDVVALGYLFRVVAL